MDVERELTIEELEGQATHYISLETLSTSEESLPRHVTECGHVCSPLDIALIFTVETLEVAELHTAM